MIQEYTMVLVFILGMNANDVNDVANLIKFSLAIALKNDTIEEDSDWTGQISLTIKKEWHYWLT